MDPNEMFSLDPNDNQGIYNIPSNYSPHIH